MNALAAHPCFDARARRRYARIHLPVAPRCNVSCRYCVRRYDCASENRPGVTSRLLTPAQAVRHLAEAAKADPRLQVVGIAGPGDPLANQETFEALELARQGFPGMLLCLSTNGLMLPESLPRLLALGLDTLTVTVNAVDPKIAQEIYRWVRLPEGRLTGRAAAEALFCRQLSGLRQAARSGVRVKVNSVLIPGVNDGHLKAVAREVARLGATVMNILPLIPQGGFSGLPAPSSEELEQARAACRSILPVMEHCRRCRADALGLVDGGGEEDHAECGTQESGLRTRDAWEVELGGAQAGTEPFRCAVASKDGRLVDEHFGYAKAFHIFEVDEGKRTVRALGAHELEPYCRGPGECEDPEERLRRVATLIEDCRYLLCSRIGFRPERYLQERGITVVQTYDKIERALLRLEGPST